MLDASYDSTSFLEEGHAISTIRAFLITDQLIPDQALVQAVALQYRVTNAVAVAIQETASPLLPLQLSMAQVSMKS